jgi:hypothetical protein
VGAHSTTSSAQKVKKGALLTNSALRPANRSKNVLVLCSRVSATLLPSLTLFRSFMFGVPLVVYPQGIDILNGVACKTSDAREGDPNTGVRGREILRPSRRPSPVYPPARFSSFLRSFFHALPSFRVRRGLDPRKLARISDASRL